MDFRKSRISADRSFWSYSKVQGVMSRLLRNRRFQVTDKARSFEYLNVGCGPYPTEGFCNIDYGWRPGVMAFDITRGIPLPDSSLRGIYTEHCLEHLGHAECVGVLQDFKRLLKPGGVARIVVPDAEIYCRLYVGALDGQSVTWPYAEPGKLPVHYVNRIMRSHGHRFIYDFAGMRESLLAAGFGEVRRASFNQGIDPRLLLDLEHRRIESLYVEAVA